MDQKEITRIAVIRSMQSMFDGITDDESALFAFETLGEFPDDQQTSAIDVNGVHASWLYKTWPFPMFMEALHGRIKMNAKSVELNELVNQL